MTTTTISPSQTVDDFVLRQMYPALSGLDTPVTVAPAARGPVLSIVPSSTSLTIHQNSPATRVAVLPFKR